MSQGINVLHRCDQPRCVNPAHLFLGTRKDNTQDAITKGRFFANRHDHRGGSQPGERNPRAKLTSGQVYAIRALKGQGTQQEIARQFGVSQRTVSKIQTGQLWTHLTEG
jgi:DNA invertase Pin-like site-specific DNA recombinase